MALEELLKKHESDGGSERPSSDRAELHGRESLIRQAAAMIGQTGEESEAPAADEDGSAEAACCADGYVRRSPVQPYRTAPDFRAKRIRKAVLIVVGICAAALLVLALVRAGMLRF